MKVELDSFSSGKIYPGRGRLFVRGDSKVFRFNTSKSESLFLQRKNPRKISWTILYRRMHKKGITEEVAKKRSRRTVKHQRAIVGASLDVIKERRAIRPEARAAARQEAIKLAKEKRKNEDAKKKAEKAKVFLGEDEANLVCCTNCSRSKCEDLQATGQGRSSYPCRQVTIECLVWLSMYRSRNTALPCIIHHRHYIIYSLCLCMP